MMQVVLWKGDQRLDALQMGTPPILQRKLAQSGPDTGRLRLKPLNSKLK